MPISSIALPTAAIPLRELRAREPISSIKIPEGTENLKRPRLDLKPVSNPHAAFIARLEALHRDVFAEVMAARPDWSSGWGQGQGAGNSQPPPSADVQEAMNQYHQASRLKSGY